MSMSTTDRVVRAATRTRKIKYAVRDVLLLAEEAKKSGMEMLYLNIGDPNLFDFATPRHIIEATYEAMKANKCGYAPSSGIPEAVEAIQAEAARKGIKSIQHTSVNSGGSEAIELALTALVNRGENVLTPSPGYPLYTAVLAKLEAVNRPYYLDEDNDWQPDLADIEAKIDDKTRAIVLINPNNPTGSLCSEETLKGLLELAIEKNIVVFSDEIYDKLTFEGRQHTSTAALSQEAKIVTFNGLSKAYIAPGFRIGWGIVSGPADELKEYVEGIQKMERARLSANHPEQYAIRPALQDSQAHIPEMMGKLLRRRDIMYERLNAIEGISCVKPGGAFYSFPRIDLGVSDTDFCKRLIAETGVVVVPGSGFGQRPGTEHFRVVFLPQEEVLERAFEQIARIAAEYR